MGDAQSLLQSLENPEEVLKKRKEKIINWIKKPDNLLLTLILAFAIIIRLYYFLITKDQAIWWDGAEYMNMARAWAFNLEYEFLPVRPVLFSLIIALFYRMGNPEFLARIFLFLLSIVSIFGMYLFGKEIYNKKIGLIASFLMSVFYLHLFHTFRLLVDLPSLTFFTFAAFFFYKYFKTNSHKALYFGAIIIAIGTLFRITTAIFLFAIAIYVLITERLGCIKKKEYWIAGLIFILILSPYVIWGYFQFNGFVIAQAGAWNAPKGNYFFNGMNNFKSYLSIFPNMLSWPLLIFFILGLISIYKLFLGFDLVIKGKDNRLKRDLLLLLLFLIPIIAISFSIGGGYFEDRYMFNSMPAIFIISGAFMLKAYNFIKQKRKFLAILFLILLLGSIMFLQLQHADSLIKTKKDSYFQVKQAGLWLRENTEASDIIATKSQPQIQYYSERKVVGLLETKEEFEEKLTSNPNINFFMVSIFENHPEWAYTYPNEKNLTVVQAYFVNNNQEQISLVIYKIY